jgi:hypothetical protein
MNVEYIEKEPSSKYSSAPVMEIVYNGKVYGEWDEESNVNFPEDLTLSRDLSYLVSVGIEIGKQMQKDVQGQST